MKAKDLTDEMLSRLFSLRFDTLLNESREDVALVATIVHALSSSFLKTGLRQSHTRFRVLG
jgi:hypothetical protein